MSYNAIKRLFRSSLLHVIEIEIQPTCKSKDPNQLNMYSCYTSAAYTFVKKLCGKKKCYHNEQYISLFAKLFNTFHTCSLMHLLHICCIWERLLNIAVFSLRDASVFSFGQTVFSTFQ